jgi:hypothetical protein
MTAPFPGGAGPQSQRESYTIGLLALHADPPGASFNQMHMNTFGNWQDHEKRAARAFDRSMTKAQAAYDAQTPPDGDNCRDGQHDWHRLPGEAKDGTKFIKCRRCGATEET